MTASKPVSPGTTGAGAGLTLASASSPKPDPATTSKGESSIASRALALSTYFFSGALCINLSQMLGTPLYLVNEDWYNAWIAFTKQSFGLLTMTLTQAFAPTTVIVSGDESVRGQLLRKTDGTLLLDFPQRIILIANHQIYTDWLYLWWTAYCSGMHGRLYFMLKESLKRIPVLGWGMQYNQFIFLKRNWEKDRPNMARALMRLNKAAEPMWLLLFPEGTNLAPSTRQKSAEWARKNGMKDMRHCLLPRSTGLRFCLEELKNTVDYLYDCTVAYEGVPRGAYAQDIFTLKAGYLEGRPPKSVSMYWRRFAIRDIPVHDQKAFELWLTARWREKDLLIENYLIHGHFPSDSGTSKTSTGGVKRGCGHLEVPIRSSHWYEFLQIFAPMGVLAMILYVFYDALPQKLWKAFNDQALKSNSDDVKKLASSAPTRSDLALPSSFNLDSIFDKEKQVETIGSTSMAMGQWLQSPEARRLLSRAETVQKWLEDPQKVLTDAITKPKSPEQQSFLKSLQEEEARRKQLQNPHGKGTFWKDLETKESNKDESPLVLGSTARISPNTQTSNTRSRAAGGRDTTFQAALKRAEARKKNPDAHTSTLPAKKTRSGTFWDDLKKEEAVRTGSVTTMSSSASWSTSASTKPSNPSNTLPSRSQPVAAPATAVPPAQKKAKNPPLKPGVNQKSSRPASTSTPASASASVPKLGEKSKRDSALSNRATNSTTATPVKGAQKTKAPSKPSTSTKPASKPASANTKTVKKADPTHGAAASHKVPSKLDKEKQQTATKPKAGVKKPVKLDTT